MNSIRCVIADDEPLALELVENFVDRVPYLSRKASFNNAWDLGEYLEDNKVDLLLLDIEMPGLDSITFLKSLKEVPSVIFITAHRKFAVEAFEVNAVDYLLKPVSFDRFLKALNKLKPQNTIDNEESHIKAETDNLFILSERKMVRVKFNDILYIEAKGDYLKFFLENEKPIISKMTLKFCLTLIPSSIFSQIHRSFIVNRNKVNAYTNEKVQVGEDWLKISRGYKNNFNN